MPTLVVGAALAFYAAALFAVGWWSQRRQDGSPGGAAWLTALSIGVYCTSWTFYGAVGTAARSGWDYLPIYLGPILAFTLGLPLIRRTVRLGKGHGATSLPDLLSRRFGRSSRLAALVTATLVLVSIPYIALQLLAVASTFAQVTGSAETRSPALILSVTVVLAAFGLLFGTRNRDVTRANPGLVGAMAFDSVFKLLAFGGVAGLGLFVLARGGGGGGTAILPEAPLVPDRFVILTALSAFMVLCLPRQFHMTVVEPDGEATVRRAAPLVIGYFALFALMVLPIAAAGRSLGLGQRLDLLVLDIPAALGLAGLELFAFTGGFAAAAGMIVVAGVALGAMVTSDIVLPVLTRSGSPEAFRHALAARRIGLCVVMGMAAVFALVVPDGALLAELGIAAFAGAGQLAPLLVAALFLERVPERAALLGLLAGTVGWLLFVLGPSFFAGTALDAGAAAEAVLPFFSDGFTAGTVFSLILNAGVMALVTIRTPSGLEGREEAARFRAIGPPALGGASVPVRDLRSLLVQIVGEDEAAEIVTPDARGTASQELLRAVESKLSGVLGNASANILLTRLLSSGDMRAGDVMILMGDASRGLRFSQELLATTLESLAEGVSVIDGEGRLVAWNRTYEDLFRYPEGFLRVGTPLEDLLRHNLPELGEAEIGARVAKLKQGRPHTSETMLRDGRIVRLQGRPAPGGGYVTSFSDVTEYRDAEAALAESERATRFYTDNVPFPIGFSDAGGTIRFHNLAYARMNGSAGESLVGRPLRDVLGEGYELRREAVEGVLQGQAQRFVLGPDTIGGRTTWQVTYVPQISSSGTVLGFFGFYQDISKRRAAQAALEEANRTLEVRVSTRTAELRAANEAADAARREAEAANRSKTRFLAAASHDVLQPLNAARLFASSLEDSPAIGTEDRQTARRIGAAIVSADTLLRSLLNLSKLDAGGVDPKKETLVLGPYLEEMAAEFRVLGAEKKLQVRNVPTGLAVRTDPGLLRSALQNLLSNAVRYTDEGGVLIGARRRGAEVAIEVVDTGRGIAEEDIPKVFDEFSRLSRDLAIDGAGLGLATVRRVADLLGHGIEVSSVPGRGTVFRIVLPRKTPSVRKPRRGPAALSDLSGRRILCVDNDGAVLDALTTRFERWGARAEGCRSVAAVRRAYEGDGAVPDLLVLDYQLDDGQTGLDVLDFFRREKGAACPAIIVTASRSEETDDAIAEAGVPVLAKPVEPAALRSLSVSLLSAQTDERRDFVPS